MTRPSGRCPECGRMVTLVNARYPKLPTTLRAHYPKPYSHYETRNQPLPRTYCPGSAKPPENKP